MNVAIFNKKQQRQVVDIRIKLRVGDGETLTQS